MAHHLTKLVPMSAHRVLIGFRWKPCCKALLALVIGVSLSAWAQPRLTPKSDQIVLPASVHAQNNQASSLREVEREWRKNRNHLPAALNYARAVFLLGLTEGDLRWYGSAASESSDRYGQRSCRRPCAWHVPLP